MREINYNPLVGSHLPALMDVALVSSGPIVELGAGVNSTIFLHWLCWTNSRKLVTYENDEAFFKYAKLYQANFHEVHFIRNWDRVDLSGDYSVVLVDTVPEWPKRRRALERLTHVEYVVVHDTQARKIRCHYSQPTGALYKFHKLYQAGRTETTVYSNVHDLSNLGSYREHLREYA